MSIEWLIWGKLRESGRNIVVREFGTWVLWWLYIERVMEQYSTPFRGKKRGKGHINWCHKAREHDSSIKMKSHKKQKLCLRELSTHNSLFLSTLIYFFSPLYSLAFQASFCEASGRNPVESLAFLDNEHMFQEPLLPSSPTPVVDFLHSPQKLI